MDPDENLRLQIRLAKRIADDEADDDDDLELAELVLAMHEWLKKGGFLPQAWRRR